MRMKKREFLIITNASNNLLPSEEIILQLEEKGFFFLENNTKTEPVYDMGKR